MPADESDALHRFILDGSPIRGETVRLASTWQAMLERRAYPAPIRRVVGECVAAVALLAATIKFEGTLTVQARKGAVIDLLVVEATGGRTLRGLARWHDDPDDDSTVEDLLAGAQLVITIDPGEGRERYQGIVEVHAPSVAEVLESYFERSEQLPTRMWLAADEDCVGGLLLQRLPSEDNVLHEEEHHEAWQRSVMLASTVSGPELLGLGAHRLLGRLFHQEPVRVFSPERWSFRCTCSRERVSDTLRMLGRAEVEDVLAEEGSVDVTCEFCGNAYRFDAVDVAGLFSDATAGPQRTDM